MSYVTSILAGLSGLSSLSLITTISLVTSSDDPSSGILAGHQCQKFSLGRSHYIQCQHCH